MPAPTRANPSAASIRSTRRAGGTTPRYSLSGEWHRRGEAGTTLVSAYAMRYRLDLYSNFTYALERPDTGDQFNQRDSRSVYGLDASHAFDHALVGLPARSEFGLQLRHDRIRVGLFDTQARQRIADHARRRRAADAGSASTARLRRS